MVSRSALVAFASTLLLGASAHARIMDLGDSMRIGDAAAEKWTTEHPVARQMIVQLEAEGIKENAAKQIMSGVDRRAAGDIRRFATTLEGTSLDEEGVRVAMAGYLKVLRYNVQTNPRGYSQGKTLGYTVTDAEAQRLSRGLLATWIEHEKPLRARLDELSMMGEIQPNDATAIRTLVRSMTVANAKKVITGMHGASFWSAADAEYFLESSFDEMIDHVAAERLADPATRADFIEEAKGAVATETSSGPIGFNGDRVENAAPVARKSVAAVHAGRAH